MLVASGLTVAFLLAGLSAWRWLRGDRGPGVAAALRTGVSWPPCWRRRSWWWATCTG
jgi:cytochrome bd-type quinol oxidase subunit 1